MIAFGRHFIVRVAHELKPDTDRAKLKFLSGQPGGLKKKVNIGISDHKI